jgi:hypothetical protein
MQGRTNLSLRANLEKEGIDKILEFTSPEIPEQNGKVEQSFPPCEGLCKQFLNYL